MENITMFAGQWLASACPATAAAGLKLPRPTAVRAEALSQRERSVACGIGAEAFGHGTLAQLPVLTGRSLGDELTYRTTDNSGVQGPQYAWREPVRT